MAGPAGWLARRHEATKAKGCPCSASPPLRLLPASRARHYGTSQFHLMPSRMSFRDGRRDAALAKQNRSAPGFKEIKDKEFKELKDFKEDRGGGWAR